MLVLTRKKSETIQIGENITIRVIRTGTTTVKIGIDAPADVRILRGELCDQPLTATKHNVLEWKPSEAERMEPGQPCSNPLPQIHSA